MNIFVLYSDPRLAAYAHCDQHINKMIVESAQMASTAMHQQAGFHDKRYLMKPAYQSHPCTVWASKNLHNLHWLLTLATALESLRDSGRENAATPVIRVCKDWCEEQGADWRAASEFQYCGIRGPATDSLPTVPAKYQRYYWLKQQQWLAPGSGTQKMSYHGRMLPEFLSNVVHEVPHTYAPGFFTQQRILDLYFPE